MGSKVRASLSTRRALVVIVGLAFALGWVVPSYGASAFKLAVKALGRANTAVHDSAVAVNTSNNANSTANGAKTTANAAQSTAGAASTKAQQALDAANSIVEPAFARVASGCSSPSNIFGCSFNRARGVTSVRQTSTAGQYCITASGYSPSAVSWTAAVDAGATTTPAQTQALPSTGSGCNASEFQVVTTRSGSGASDVAFFVVID